MLLRALTCQSNEEINTHPMSLLSLGRGQCTVLVPRAVTTTRLIISYPYSYPYKLPIHLPIPSPIQHPYSNNNHINGEWWVSKSCPFFFLLAFGFFSFTILPCSLFFSLSLPSFISPFVPVVCLSSLITLWPFGSVLPLASCLLPLAWPFLLPFRLPVCSLVPMKILS